MLVGALIGLLLGIGQRCSGSGVGPARRAQRDLAHGRRQDRRGGRSRRDEEQLYPRRSRASPSSSTASTSSTTRPRDGTAEKAEVDSRVHLIRHEENRGGVGAAIVQSYRQAIADRIDVTCVMAADNQMAPDDLEAIARPVVSGDADYAKANRLVSGEAWQLIRTPATSATPC